MLFRHTPGIGGEQSVAMLKTVEINGIKQMLLIRGENRRNPILLFLHGGPGSAQIAFARKYMKDLERDFVVVNWDQRGAGLSYNSQIPSESMTIEQFIDDARVLSEWLLSWFGQEKLFLVGHSWGSVLGTLTAARYPHLFHAYIGMGQVTSMAEGEAASYQFVLETAKERGMTKAVAELERIGPPPYKDWMKDLGVQRKWLGELGGFIRQGSMAQLVRQTIISTEYTLWDSVKHVQGQSFSIRHMWDQLMSVDLPVQVPQLAMPVYYMLGRYDQNCPTQLAVNYFNRLQAPYKELFWFENSGHLLFVEEPDQFAAVMRKVLQDHSCRVPAVS